MKEKYKDEGKDTGKGIGFIQHQHSLLCQLLRWAKLFFLLAKFRIFAAFTKYILLVQQLC